MAKRPARLPSKTEPLTRLVVEGFKSIRRRQAIDVRPLTVLAGANSAGKSSILQALLLLKQTLDATYDPGPLLLDGPNVRFTAATQLFSKLGATQQVSQFSIGLEASAVQVEIGFGRSQDRAIHLKYVSQLSIGKQVLITPEMSPEESRTAMRSLRPRISEVFAHFKDAKSSVERNRCFLEIKVELGPDGPITGVSPGQNVEAQIQEVIHVPGLRGNPVRTYPVTAVGPTFAGTFETYTAAVIAKWQDEADSARLAELGANLAQLGLTWKVLAKRLNDTQVEIQVGRTTHALRGGAHDLVNIADVGFGVSQVLPVLVALQAARPGQLVYIEQPEIHLHPKAQVSLASLLARASKRGVRVVFETHSSLLLTAVQALVASNELAADLVKLHWFTRDKDGITSVASADLDDSGTFGPWPEDFGQVALDVEARLLNGS